jgi:hypothetical protein
MEEVQAELEVEAIEEGWCGGRARRRQAGRRRAAVSAPARLAATVESERASEEGDRGQKRWRQRQCATGWGVKASRRRRVASSSAHGRNAARADCRGQLASAREREGEEARRGLGRGSAWASERLWAHAREGENRAPLASGPKGKRRPAMVRNGFPILFPNKFSNNFN